jgi:stress response protein YsnF
MDAALALVCDGFASGPDAHANVRMNAGVCSQRARDRTTMSSSLSREGLERVATPRRPPRIERREVYQARARVASSPRWRMLCSPIPASSVHYASGARIERSDVMLKTIIGVFERRAAAERVRDELRAMRFDPSTMHLGGGTNVESDEEKGFWTKLKEWLGISDDENTYREAARKGRTILTVQAEDDRIDEVVAVMQRNGVLDINGTAGASGQRADEREVIPVVEEDLEIGKRRVTRGGVRVYTRVLEEPVEEEVELQNERVTVDRRKVNRPVRPGDVPTEERTIETAETTEEPVVRKSARVVEEVVVKKEVEQKREKVRDTVRRTDVSVEPLGANKGGREDYDRFVRDFSANPRFKGKPWQQVEPEARSACESRFPGQWNALRERMRAGFAQAG